MKKVALILFSIGLLSFWPMGLPPFAMDRYCQVGQGRIYFQAAGEGRPILLIHGWMASSRYWDDILLPLSRSGQVLAIDLPGFGRSDKLEKVGYSISDLLGGLDRYIETMGLKRVTLVGHSMGGTLALQYSLLHPDRVEGLVLVGSPFRPRPRSALSILLGIPLLGRFFFWLGSGPLAPFLMERAFFEKSPIPKALLEDLKKVPYRIMVNSMRSLRTVDLRKKLFEIQAPTLIIWGKEDRLVPLSVGEELHGGIRGSRMVALERVGHCPMVEAPERFLKEVQDFIALGLTSRPGSSK